MSLSIAIQMDAVESIQISGDTTFALGLEAQKRGYNLWYYTPDRLSLNEGCISARGQKITYYEKHTFSAHGGNVIGDSKKHQTVLVKTLPTFWA